MLDYPSISMLTDTLLPFHNLSNWFWNKVISESSLFMERNVPTWTNSAITKRNIEWLFIYLLLRRRPANWGCIFEHFEVF